MRTQKIFIGGKSEIPIVCHECGNAKFINTSRITHINKPVKVRCTCGSVFTVIFEMRKHYRKSTLFYGTCYRADTNEIVSHITIVNLSKTGLGFTLDSNLRDSEVIQEGQCLNVQFIINENSRSVIRAKALVRCVNRTYIGVEFYAPSDHTMKEVGFYLMP